MDEEDEEVCQWCGKGMMIPCQTWCHEMQLQANREEEEEEEIDY